jgi:hypothetical protein
VEEEKEPSCLAARNEQAVKLAAQQEELSALLALEARWEITATVHRGQDERSLKKYRKTVVEKDGGLVAKVLDDMVTLDIMCGAWKNAADKLLGGDRTMSKAKEEI